MKAAVHRCFTEQKKGPSKKGEWRFQHCFAVRSWGYKFEPAPKGSLSSYFSDEDEPSNIKLRFLI